MEDTKKFFSDNILNFMKGIGVFYTIGVALKAVQQAFRFMGEVWGWMSVVWFAYLGYTILKKHVLCKKTKYKVADGLIVLFFKYLLYVALTFVVAIVGEQVRGTIDPLLGWGSLVVSYSIMFVVLYRQKANA